MNIAPIEDPMVVGMTAVCDRAGQRNFGKITMLRIIATYLTHHHMWCPDTYEQIEGYRRDAMEWLQTMMNEHESLKVRPGVPSRVPPEIALLMDQSYMASDNATSIPEWVAGARAIAAACGLAQALDNATAHTISLVTGLVATPKDRIQMACRSLMQRSGAEFTFMAHAIAGNMVQLGSMSRMGDQYTPSTHAWTHKFPYSETQFVDAENQYTPAYATGPTSSRFYFGFRNIAWFTNCTSEMLGGFIAWIKSGLVTGEVVERMSHCEFEAAMIVAGITRHDTGLRIPRQLVAIFRERGVPPEPETPTVHAAGCVPEAVPEYAMDSRGIVAQIQESLQENVYEPEAIQSFAHSDEFQDLVEAARRTLLNSAMYTTPLANPERL